MTKKRFSICYAAPGHSLVPTSGTTRNILSLAAALSKWADVTVAFRTLPKSETRRLPATLRFVAIEPEDAGRGNGVDDEATRGVNPLSHLRYFSTLRNFARANAGRFDLVLEKGWRMSGFMLRSFAKFGMLGAVIENDARCWTDKGRDLRTLIKHALHETAQKAAGYYSRRAPVVIAETDELREQLAKVRKIPRDRIQVVPLGVDHDLFQPLEQIRARAALGIDLDSTVLLYVGGMDKYHDLSPLLDSLASSEWPSLQIHLVGDGEFREQYVQKASSTRVPVVFHGRVAHESVPEYIAVSDLCLAPYCAEAFFDGVITFSTLKIPEYMACARPVASIPSGEIKRLIEDRVSGFLFPNSVAGWRSFLPNLPSRDELAVMGQTARRTVMGRNWEKTALGYLDACRSLLIRAEETREQRAAGARQRAAGSGQPAAGSRQRGGEE